MPLNDNLPARNDGDVLHGLGTCDMKGGDAVIAAGSPPTVPEPNRDVTFVFYEAEEIESEFNGLQPARRRATPTCCGPTSRS